MRKLLVLALLVAGCESEPPKDAPAAPAPAQAPAPAAAADVDATKLAMFQTLPETMESAQNPLTDEKIALGRQLFYETRLSKNHDLSCNSCHKLEAYGVDNKKV